MSELQRSPETDAMIRAVKPEDCDAVIDGVVEYRQDAPLAALRTHLNECIAGISIDSPAEDILSLRTRIGYAKKFLTEQAKQLDELFIAWIEHNGAIQVGEVKFYVGQDKKTKCANVRGVLETLFIKCEGDFDRIAEVLVSEPFKVGACKKVLSADEHATAFVVEVKPSLEEGGAKKKLVEFNPNFVR